MSAKSDNAGVRRSLAETRFGYVHIRAMGKGGTPLVLLHHSPMSCKAFDGVQPLFARDRRVLAVDRLGFGSSDHAPRELEMSEYALATLDALGELEVERFDVVAIHTGALEAIELATAHAERVARVGLVGVPVWTEGELQEANAFFENLVPIEPVADGSHLGAIWQEIVARAEGRYGDDVNPAAPGADQGSPVELVHSWLLHWLIAGPNWWWAVRAVLAYPTPDRLAAIMQPLTVLRGQDDIWRQTERAVAHLPPHAEHIEIPHLDIEAFAIAPEEIAGHFASLLTRS